MSTERLPLPTEHVLDLIRRTALWDALVAVLDVIRRVFGLKVDLPGGDTSIAWEDGEIEETDPRP